MVRRMHQSFFSILVVSLAFWPARISHLPARGQEWYFEKRSRWNRENHEQSSARSTYTATCRLLLNIHPSLPNSASSNTTLRLEAWSWNFRNSFVLIHGAKHIHHYTLIFLLKWQQSCQSSQVYEPILLTFLAQRGFLLYRRSLRKFSVNPPATRSDRQKTRLWRNTFCSWQFY